MGLRWIEELRRPSLKCERVGHRPRGEWRRGYVPGRGGWLGGVATRLRQERDVCKRCAVETMPWTTVDGSARTISSLTASTDNWERIETGGWWPDTGYCAPHFPAETGPSDLAAKPTTAAPATDEPQNPQPNGKAP